MQSTKIAVDIGTTDLNFDKNSLSEIRVYNHAYFVTNKTNNDYFWRA